MDHHRLTESSKHSPADYNLVMRVAVLYNPVAGRGRSAKGIRRAMGVFQNLGAKVDLVESNSSAHLTELASKVSSEAYERIVIAGGDGTLNRVLRGLNLERTVAGLLPLGSGDDFAQAAGIPRSITEACKVVLNGRQRLVDVATVNGVRYLGVAGLGFDSEVARYANEKIRWLRGSLLYLYATLAVIQRFQPRSIRYSVDGVVRDEEVMFVVVGNSPRYGAGVHIAPSARIDDGILDMVVISKATKWQLLSTMPLAYKGRHVMRPFVSSHRGKDFRFESPEPMDVYADGELVGHTPATIRLEPRKLRLMVPDV